MNTAEDNTLNPGKPVPHTDREKEQEQKNIAREHIAPPPREPRVGDDYRHHPKPVPGVDLPGEVPGDDLENGGRSEGMGYDRGSAQGKGNDQFWSSEDKGA